MSVNEREGAEDASDNFGDSDRMARHGKYVRNNFIFSLPQIACGIHTGGQANCPECRCLRSTLVELTRLGSSSPSFGLCYRTNCYRENYLQVGVKGALSGDVNW